MRVFLKVEFVLKLMKKKKINKEIISEILDDYFQLITVTTFVTTTFLTNGCTFRLAKATSLIIIIRHFIIIAQVMYYVLRGENWLFRLVM